MGANLYSYQKDAIMRMKNGSILCGSVGSGKSRTALAYYYCIECKGSIKEGSEKSMENPKDLYIITTARKRDTKEWEAELSFFDISKDVKVVIDSWNNIKKYIDVEGAFFIFDEQRVVGSGSWVRSFIKITKKNHWILLSATPGDTWSDYIPVFIANGYYKNRTEFLRRHAVYSYYSKYPKIEKYLETRLLIKLRDSILVKMDYVHDIEKVELSIPVGYDKLKYKRIWADRWDIYEEEPIENISKLCYLVRRVVNSDFTRIDAVKNLCHKHPRVIVFYNFDYELDILKDIDYEEDTIIAEWNGKKHEPIPKTKRWVYLVQYTAGAEGWNCIDTDTIIFYSLNYSYKTMMQASGRIDRLNTPFDTLYYYYIRSAAPIDLAIHRCLKKKKNFNESRYVT